MCRCCGWSGAMDQGISGMILTGRQWSDSGVGRLYRCRGRLRSGCGWKPRHAGVAGLRRRPWEGRDCDIRAIHGLPWQLADRISAAGWVGWGNGLPAAEHRDNPHHGKNRAKIRQDSCCLTKTGTEVMMPGWTRNHPHDCLRNEDTMARNAAISESMTRPSTETMRGRYGRIMRKTRKTRW